MCYKNCKNATITEGFPFTKCMKCNIFMAEKSCNARERQLEKLRLKVEILFFSIISKSRSEFPDLAKIASKIDTLGQK